MTNAEFAILSLIGEKDRYGYEIEQTIEARGMREWTEIGFSSIYYILKKLLKSGNIQCRFEESQGKGPGRKVYSITKVGSQTLIQCTLDNLSHPRVSSSSFLLGLSNTPVIPRDHLIDSLKNYALDLTERYDRLSKRAEQQGTLPKHVEAMFDYSLCLIMAEATWISNFLRQVEEGDVED